MTAADFAELVLKLALIGIVLSVVLLAVVFVFDLASAWALGRESERTAAASFGRDFIPYAGDVADQDVVAMVEEMVALLDDSIIHVDRLGRAAG